MAAQFAEAELIDPTVDHASAAGHHTGLETADGYAEGRILAARGIVNAVLISAPVWLLIALVAYLVL